MHSDLRGKPSLLIVSDTAMCHTGNGVAVFEPTLREIEQLTKVFEEIHWIGFDSGTQAGNMRLCAEPAVTFTILKRTGGPGIKSKFSIVLSLLSYYRIIREAIKGNKIVHTRAPSVPALIAILYSLFDKNRVYWHKFAGNWVQENPPMSYGLQRKLLKRARHTIVTVNGRWPDQEPHVLSFENPCFTDEELKEAHRAAANKDYSSSLTFCFVGRTEAEKGLGILLEALPLLQNPETIAKVYIVGDGPQAAEFKKKAQSLPFAIEFTGAIARDELNKVYKQSHIFCLPSYASEGFPKVIAEAATFGCVPVVSSVSSITQYINNTNGRIIDELVPQSLAKILDELIADRITLRSLSRNSIRVGDLYTYSLYGKRIMNVITEKINERDES
jgi:glycosyltransferase involved in cell wall biosynthesis